MGELADRVKQLYQTNIPLPFELYFACEVRDAAFVERMLHDAFDDHRVSKNREFFRLAPERAKAALSIGSIREIKLGDEIFETLDEKAEVEAAKRRTRFRLSMLGMKPGAELRLYRDPSIACKTVDEINQVEFRGEITSLSDAALKAIKGLGIDNPSASGPWEWTFEGKRLDDLRREIEEKSD